MASQQIPHLLASAKTDFKILLKEICSEIKGPVSAEVTCSRSSFNVKRG
jgi:hypothetical protein